MANGRKALGKGLSALIPNTIENEDFDKIQEIEVSLITPNPNQPRKVFEDEKLNELAESIKKYGLIQPIIVKKDGNIYSIIAGERRWRASKIAKIAKIPCIVRDIENKNASELALIENIQREDLNPIDEATAYEYLMQRYDITQEQVAEVVGKSRVYVTNTLRLLGLDLYVRELVSSNEISQGHGRTLVGLSKENQIELANKIIKDGISVRELERIVKNIKTNNGKKEKIKEKDKFVVNIEELLTNKFSTKVKISTSRNKGKIEIEFKNNDDLNRILEMLDIDEE